MRIADVAVHVVREVDKPVDNRQLAAIVIVTAENGVKGFAEANANPAAVKAFIESGIGLADNWDDAPRSILADVDVTDPSGAWTALTRSSFWSCRAGIGYVALAALGTALWDLAGKLAAKPVYQMIHTGEVPEVIPYVTLYHGPADVEGTIARNREAISWAREHGFRAVKVEALPDNVADESRVVEVVADAREVAGADCTILVDVGYRWSDAETATKICSGLHELGVHAIEAPFRPEDLQSYRALAESCALPIATGDMLSAPLEYHSLIESGAVAIVQAGAARTGFNGLLELSERASSSGVQVVTWGWCATGAALAANVHASMLFPGPRVLLEYTPLELYPGAQLRRELFTPEPLLHDGSCIAPNRPGFGVELDERVLERYLVSVSGWTI